MGNTKYASVGFKKPLKEITSNWFDTYKFLSQKESHHVLLESGRGGRYSIIGLHPWAVINGKDGKLSVQTKNGTETKKGSLLEILRGWLQEHKAEKNEQLPDFQGGIIGQLSYDIVREIEKLPQQSQDDLETPDLYFMAFNQFVVIDHKDEDIWFIAVCEKTEEEKASKSLRELEKEWKTNGAQESAQNRAPFKAFSTAAEETGPAFSFPEESFKKAVERTKEYIAAGDSFQVNLSVRETRVLKTPPLHIYSCLRKINPSPYMGYLHTPEFQYVSASPELLVKVKNDEVSTRPIAGTRSRGKNEAEDQALADTLINNEKERAEHVMLVDLERNDIGRVCQYGTVEVNELMVIEKYSHVMHIVSNVRGKKAEGHDTIDVVEATFPGGTITGAPKVRTMEIIEELEPVRRGIYTGSTGWIGYNGDMELNITIRTMIAKNGQAHVQAGAGIVIDSDPGAEFKECFKKAKALWKAKEMSEEELKFQSGEQEPREEKI